MTITKTEISDMMLTISILLGRNQSAVAYSVASVLLRSYCASHPYASDMKDMEDKLNKLFDNFGFEFHYTNSLKRPF